MYKASLQQTIPAVWAGRDVVDFESGADAAVAKGFVAFPANVCVGWQSQTYEAAYIQDEIV